MDEEQKQPFFPNYRPPVQGIPVADRNQAKPLMKMLFRPKAKTLHSTNRMQRRKKGQVKYY